jgi:hypothetical protein
MAFDRQPTLQGPTLALRSYATVELRVSADNTRTRGAVEDVLGAAYVETVATPLGDDAVYEVSREAWAAVRPRA